MQIDVTQCLQGAGDEPVISGDDQPVTLRSAISTALQRSVGGDSIDNLEKYRRYKWADKIELEDEPDLGEGEWESIRDVVGASYGPAVMGPCWDLLGEAGIEIEEV